MTHTVKFAVYLKIKIFHIKTVAVEFFGIQW